MSDQPMDNSTRDSADARLHALETQLDQLAQGNTHLTNQLSNVVTALANVQSQLQAQVQQARAGAVQAQADLRAAQSTATQPPSETAINSLGELVELASRLLALRFQLTRDELTAGLEQIDVRRTSLWRSCPLFFRAAAAFWSGAKLR